MEQIRDLLNRVRNRIPQEILSVPVQRERCNLICQEIEKENTIIGTALENVTWKDDKDKNKIKADILQLEKIYLRIGRYIRRVETYLCKAKTLHQGVVVELQDLQLKVRRVMIRAFTHLETLEKSDDSDSEDFTEMLKALKLER